MKAAPSRSTEGNQNSRQLCRCRPHLPSTKTSFGCAQKGGWHSPTLCGEIRGSDHCENIRPVKCGSEQQDQSLVGHRIRQCAKEQGQTSPQTRAAAKNQEC